MPARSRKTRLLGQLLLPETAFGGPKIGYVGVYRQVIVAWSGTDPLHHLNVAVVGM
jgi:hypothetical protein